MQAGKADIERSVEIVGEPWRKSTYYADAERWTHLFWNEGTTFRRLFDQLDPTAVLELACGYGRHAERTAVKAGRLVLMDIFADNLDVCRQRLRNFPSVEYHLGNGYDFQPVGDGALTAIYCYDAMVHFSPDIVKSYLTDTARVLSPGGRALYHHSNFPAPLDRHYGLNPHARNHMTRQLFADYSRKAGLTVVEAVIADWGNEKGLDCITLVQR